jgi:hypothetical protein
MSATERRQHYREIANRARRIPGEHGLRPWRVFAAVGTWSGSGHFGDGERADTEVELLESGQPPKVRQVSAEQVALDSGLQSGDWFVGPVTPEVGTPWATLAGQSTVSGESFRLRLVHDETGDDMQCVVVATTSDRALQTIFTVRPVRGLRG